MVVPAVPPEVAGFDGDAAAEGLVAAVPLERGDGDAARPVGDAPRPVGEASVVSSGVAEASPPWSARKFSFLSSAVRQSPATTAAATITAPSAASDCQRESIPRQPAGNQEVGSACPAPGACAPQTPQNWAPGASGAPQAGQVVPFPGGTGGGAGGGGGDGGGGGGRGGGGGGAGGWTDPIPAIGSPGAAAASDPAPMPAIGSPGAAAASDPAPMPAIGSPGAAAASAGPPADSPGEPAAMAPAAEPAPPAPAAATAAPHFTQKRAPSRSSLPHRLHSFSPAMPTAFYVAGPALHTSER